VQSVRRVGRPQRPVDPGDGPGQQLALALRRLREDKGNPPYRVMAGRVHYSASALARAASGAVLPSRDLVLAYVQACGGDQAEWEQRWAAAAAGSAPSAADVASLPDAGQPAAVPVRSAPRRRRSWLLPGVAGAVLLALTAVLAGLSLPAASGGRHPAAGPSATSSPAPLGTEPGARVGVRRQGTLTMVPGTVADLDSMAAGWAEQPDPGPATADIWFGAADHALHGVGNNDIAVLPPGQPDGFWACALEQDFGVTLAAPAIRTGTILCGLTAADLVAELQVTGVHRDADGMPDQVTFKVTVWVQKHRT
jgi:Helix-turn-helix domain